ncbi:hypothetical protein [Streptomyces hydrogenans]|uniref:hypothetical protein n=1 Tax=Streptomyces hydrogenans TaxID=1873719 RepID=UPI003803C443
MTGDSEAGEDAVLGDDDAGSEELRQRHRGCVVRIAPVPARHLVVDPQDVTGLRGEVVADLQVDYPDRGQDPLFEHAACQGLRRTEVASDLGQMPVDLVGDVGGDVWDRAAGERERGELVLLAAALGQGAGFYQQRVGVEDGQQHRLVQRHRVERRPGRDRWGRCRVGTIECHEGKCRHHR